MTGCAVRVSKRPAGRQRSTLRIQGSGRRHRRRRDNPLTPFVSPLSTSTCFPLRETRSGGYCPRCPGAHLGPLLSTTDKTPKKIDKEKGRASNALYSGQCAAGNSRMAFCSFCSFIGDAV